MSFNQRVMNTFQLNTPQFRVLPNQFGGATIIWPKFKLTPLGGLSIIRGPHDTSSMYSGAQSFASFSFNIGSNRLNSPTHPVQWLHTKTKKIAFTIPMLSDSGADYSTLDSKYASQVGISDLRKGLQATVQGTGGQVANAFYIHSIPFKIGTLAPQTALVAMGQGAGTNVLGRTAGLNWFQVTYTKNTVKYTELAGAQSAYGFASRRYRS